MAPKAGKARSDGDATMDTDMNDIDSDDHQLVEVCLTSKIGLGLFAKEDIKRGTRILSEAPLTIISTEDAKTPFGLQQRLEKLSACELDAFDSLHCHKELLDSETCHSIREYVIASGRFGQCPDVCKAFIEIVKGRYGIFQTNAASMGPQRGFGIFLWYSRINHSCTPNVCATYNHSLARYTVHAIRDIKAGEEIYAAYTDCARPTKIRAAPLAKKGVDCYCADCNSSIAVKGEKNRARLYNIARGLEAYDSKMKTGRRVDECWIPRNPTDALETAEQRIYLLKQEGLVGMELAAGYRQASRYCIQVGMVEKAMAYAKKELEIERCCLGVETEYLNSSMDGGKAGGNAEHWMKSVEKVAEMKKIEIQKKTQKEQKQAAKKAAKKNGKR